MADLTLATIQVDDRGAIYALGLPGDREVMLFFCRQGSKRGGHSHDCREVVLVLSGHLRYHKVKDGVTVVTDHVAGDVCYNERDEPHMGEFLEDTWIIEAKINVKNGEWTTTDFEPLRRLVRGATR